MVYGITTTANGEIPHQVRMLGSYKVSHHSAQRLRDDRLKGGRLDDWMIGNDNDKRRLKAYKKNLADFFAYSLERRRRNGGGLED